MIAVVDYGMGNLRSVEKALEKAGAQVRVTSSPSVVRKAAGIVLPGVGAFGEAARRLAREKLIDPLVQAIAAEKPFLGICLGLQLLFDRSEESPGATGLSIFPGVVRRFKFAKRRMLKVPHMGWNTLQKGKSSMTPMLRNARPSDYFYFVHSYYPVPEESGIVAATTSYGLDFCSAVARRSLFASQFHPEKSGTQGLRILRNFVQVVNRCS